MDTKKVRIGPHITAAELEQLCRALSDQNAEVHVILETSPERVAAYLVRTPRPDLALLKRQAE